MRNRSAVVYVLFFTSLLLLLSLGGWQWRRGVEKAAIETLLEDSKNQYITLEQSPPNWDGLAYRQVRLQGEWRTVPVFLLANRTHRGRLGYEVFSPFQLAGDGSALLVNRGWISEAAAANNDLNLLSVNLHNPTRAAVTGQLYVPEKGFTLGPATATPSGNVDGAGYPQPTVIQYFDAPALSEIIGNALQPAVVALDADHPGAFERIWRAYAMNSTRHFGYAAQWWGLAATLIVFGVIWRRQSRK